MEPSYREMGFLYLNNVESTVGRMSSSDSIFSPVLNRYELEYFIFYFFHVKGECVSESKQ
jgi:hypothetical protein